MVEFFEFIDDHFALIVGVVVLLICLFGLLGNIKVTKIEIDELKNKKDKK